MGVKLKYRPTHITTPYVFFTPSCLGDASHLHIYGQVTRVIMQLLDLGNFWHDATALSGSRPPHYRDFNDYTQTQQSRYDSSGRVISTSHRLLPETHNTHNKQTSMPLEGFEPTIQTSESPQTHVLDREATGIVC
jgi:hypothetical protein